jgi:hypothetical protein
MDKKTVLIQIDTDQQPSVFDRVVAVDAGVDQVLAYGSVRLEQVQALVHGAIFTRGGADLARTAIFVGGADIASGEIFLNEVRKHMLPQHGLTVSVMLDSNGSNTTAAAAVHAATGHLELASTTALVLAGTGPVGQRVSRLLARAGADVRIGSRQRERAEGAANALRAMIPSAKLTAVSTASTADAPRALEGVQLVVACGAAGVVLLPKKIRDNCTTCKVAIDLNAVPPAGIEGIDALDKAVERDGVVCYGALAIGGTKMKLHKAAIQKLFTANDFVLDAESIYELAGAA